MAFATPGGMHTHAFGRRGLFNMRWHEVSNLVTPEKGAYAAPFSYLPATSYIRKFSS